MQTCWRHVGDMLPTRHRSGKYPQCRVLTLSTKQTIMLIFCETCFTHVSTIHMFDTAKLRVNWPTCVSIVTIVYHNSRLSSPSHATPDNRDYTLSGIFFPTIHQQQNHPAPPPLQTSCPRLPTFHHLDGATLLPVAIFCPSLPRCVLLLPLPRPL